jgi:putative endonuclease
MMRPYYVYIMTNTVGTVLYIGMTNDLERRVAEHKTLSVEGFTAKYRCTDLVYYEIYHDPTSAIAREKQLKKWSRVKKEGLIYKMNPGWNDLSISLFALSKDPSTQN